MVASINNEGAVKYYLVKYVQKLSLIFKPEEQYFRVPLALLKPTGLSYLRPIRSDLL